MRMLHHAQKIMIDQNLQSRMYAQSDCLGSSCRAYANLHQGDLLCLNRTDLCSSHIALSASIVTIHDEVDANPQKGLDS